MSTVVDVAVVGATGLTGETLLSLLAERRFPYGKVHALAPESAAGGRIEFAGGYLRVAAVEEFDFRRVRIAFFCGRAELAAEHARRAAAAGCLVIDASGHSRADTAVPLVVPEVNPEPLAAMADGIVAVPDGLATALAVALKPLFVAVGLARVDVATYQAVSGSGKSGIDELAGQAATLLNGREIKTCVYPKQIAFNCLPQIGTLDDEGYSSEERAIIADIRRLLGAEELAVAVTSVRVPVFFGDAAVIHLETIEPLTVSRAHALLSAADGVAVVGGAGQEGDFPTAVTDSANHDEVFVGRIRRDVTRPKGLNFWIVADNVRRGGALNSVQIAERWVGDYLSE